jgi:hypothetical protein
MAKRTARKTKPTDPAEIARKAWQERQKAKLPENWGVEKALLLLPAQKDVKSDEDAKGRVVRALRCDVFELLYRRGTTKEHLNQSHYDAVRQFESDLAARYRLEGRIPLDGVVVSCSATPSAVTDRSVDAGKRVDRVLVILGKDRAKLLLALCGPTTLKGELPNWRRAVEAMAGVHHPLAQAAHVRKLCAAVADAYSAMGYGFGAAPAASSDIGIDRSDEYARAAA